MEKLQAALATARQNRTEKSSGQQKGVAATPRKIRRKDSEGLWSELTPFQPTKETLKDHRVVTEVASSAATPFDILRNRTVLKSDLCTTTL